MRLHESSDAFPTGGCARPSFMLDEHDLREIPIDTGSDGNCLQEGATEVAAFVGAGGSLAGLAFGGMQAYYTRASYALQREAAQRAAGEGAEYARLQRRLHEMRRTDTFRLDGLDEFDEWHFEGPLPAFGDY